MTTYSNPRMHAQFDDWPSGRHRVTAIFAIEQSNRGERALRITSNPKTGKFNKPKKTTYAVKARIVDGEDGKTYIANLTQYGHISFMESNLQYSAESVHPEQPGYADALELFMEHPK